MISEYSIADRRGWARIRRGLAAVLVVAAILPGLAGPAWAAISSTTVWEVESGGSDTANGGGFDPANASMATDLAATSANTASPVVTSASYNFQARDVGAYVFIKAGANWTPGWYKIASVASNAATLTASAGSVWLWSSSTASGPSTVAGCATVAGPTGGTWSIDYSVQAGPGISYTDMVIGSTTTQFTSAANPVGPNIVGNVIAVTSGTGFTVQRVQVASVSGTTATCDKSLGTTASTGGNGGLGGALASPGLAAGLMPGASSNVLFVKAATYTFTTTSQNVSNGRCAPTGGQNASTQQMVIGYSTTRTTTNTDATHPTFRAGVNSVILLYPNGYCIVRNIDADNPSAFTGCTAFEGQSTFNVWESCNASGFQYGFNSASTGQRYVSCKATSCTTGGFLAAQSDVYIGCTALSMSSSAYGFRGSNYAHYFDCIAANGPGIGFDLSVTNWVSAIGCVSYNNNPSSGAAHGFSVSSSNGIALVNCIAYGNGGNGLQAGGSLLNTMLWNFAAGSNGAGNVDASLSLQAQRNLVTLTANPFTNASGGDFSLNSTAGGGAACRAAGYPSSFPGLSTTSYPDIGAAQHQASGGGGGFRPRPRTGMAPDRPRPILPVLDRRSPTRKAA